MIHVIEGPNGAGKTTFAENLSRILRLPLYVDAGRKFYQREGLSGADLQERAAPFDLLVTQMGRDHDFVLDRYWPTNYVFKRLNPDRPSLPSYLEPDPGRRAFRYRSIEAHYHVRTSAELIFERLLVRGESIDPQSVEAEVREYDRLYDEVVAFGISVVVVDGSKGLGGKL